MLICCWSRLIIRQSPKYVEIVQIKTLLLMVRTDTKTGETCRLHIKTDKHRHFNHRFMKSGFELNVVAVVAGVLA